MKHTIKLIIAFVIGQATQLIIHAMCLSFNMYNYRQIPFCMAGGFVILFAVIAGAYIAKEKEEPKHEKTYLDYAEPPIEDDTPPLTMQKVKK